MRSLARWYIALGAFLLVCGLIGYLSNPERAMTALLSGTVFGGLSALWGYLMLRGLTWARRAGLATNVLLLVSFGWRGVVSWQIVADGGSYKILASVLLTLMFAAAALVTWKTVTLKAPASDPQTSADPEDSTDPTASAG